MSVSTKLPGDTLRVTVFPLEDSDGEEAQDQAASPGIADAQTRKERELQYHQVYRPLLSWTGDTSRPISIRSAIPHQRLAH